jgi:WD40 repeat protein/tetratricopeptide (TPR) repeat protein/cellulose biosynthesis protein BcsQ
MIFTFYSYKGGVGRSMAMANIGELFYRAGLKVLMVDWDLEAPGLDRFFLGDQDRVLNNLGVMDMLLDYKKKMAQEMQMAEDGDFPFLRPEKLAIDLYPESSKGKLYLITAGKRFKDNFQEYSNAVLSFDWHDFYINWEGELYFEWLRRQFEKMADIVLIDSRTGVTEMGGVCTYQFADIVVMFCAPNRQNLDGTYQVATRFKQQDVVELREGRPLEILIVPCRVEDRAETERLNEFRKEFIDKFSQFVPDELEGGQDTLWNLRIPQVPYYAFNELVAVREKGKARSEDLITAFRSLGDAMARVGELGDIISSSSARRDVKLQNLRDFTVQIRDLRGSSPVGTGLFVSSDGKILTSAAVFLEATGVEPCEARSEAVGVYVPQASAGERDRKASIAACMSQYSDDVVLLQLDNSPVLLQIEHAARLGIADGSSNHAFKSYGFSKSADYAGVYSQGTILGDVDLPGREDLRLNPLQIESSQSPLDMPGAPVLDLELNLVVGIISAKHSPAEKGDGSALAVNAHLLALEPFSMPLQVNMGDFYILHKRYRDAIIAYEDAITEHPALVSAWIGLGRARSLMGKPKETAEAVDAFRKATEIDPGNADAWQELGKAYSMQGKYQEAEKAYQKAVEIIPSQSATWQALGDLYHRQDKNDEAIEAYQKALEEDPGIVSVWSALGELYFKSGQFDEAAEAYKRAIDLDPERVSELAPRRNQSIEKSRELQEKEKLQNQYRRYHRKSSILIRTVLALMIILLLVGGYAEYNHQRAGSVAEYKNEALAKYLAAESELALNDLSKPLDLSVLLALESLRYARTFDGEKALRESTSLMGPPMREILIEDNLNSSITSIAISPDGKRISISSNDGSVLETNDSIEKYGRNRVFKILNHFSDISSISYDSSGKYLFAATPFGVNYVWRHNNDSNIQLGNWSLGEKGIVDNYQNPIGSKFLQKGDTLVTANRYTIYLMNATSGDLLHKFDSPKRIRDFDMSKNGAYLALVHSNQVEILNISANSSRSSQHVNLARIRDISFSPDEKMIAIASDEEAGIWMLDNLTAKVPLLPNDHDKPIWKLIFSPNGDKVAALKQDDTSIYLWNTDGRVMKTIDTDNAIESIVFNPDGKLIVSTGTTANQLGVARVWNVGTGDEELRHFYESPVGEPIFSPDGTKMFINGWNRVWEGSLLSETFARKKIKCDDDPINTYDLIAFSPDNTTLAMIDGDSIHLRDAWNMSEIGTLKMNSSIGWMVFSPDGRKLAAMSEDGDVNVWIVQSQKKIAEKNVGYVDISQFSPLAFNIDGTKLAIGSNEEVRCWDMVNDSESLSRKQNGLFSVNFNPDGSRIVIVCDEGNIWDPNTNKTNDDPNTNKTIYKEFGGIFSFSENLKRVAVFTGEDVGVWNTTDGKEISHLPISYLEDIDLNDNGRQIAIAMGSTGVIVYDLEEDHSSVSWSNGQTSARRVLFSPDGKCLATFNNDETINLWEASTGRSLAILKHDEDINAYPAFSYDGRLLASFGSENNVYVWDIGRGLDNLMSLACGSLSRERLTGDEHRNYLEKEEYHQVCGCPGCPVLAQS